MDNSIQQNHHFSRTEYKFLEKIEYHIQHPPISSIVKDGKIWVVISNQWDIAKSLNVSEMTIRRIVKSLKNKGVLLTERLSPNKRDRIYYYSLNYDILNIQKGMLSCVQRRSFFVRKVERVNIDINNKKINHSKSNKSEVVLEESKEVANDAQLSFRYENERSGIRTTTAQDMLQIWNKELCRNETMSKNTARYLVACFKRKFNNSLEKWAQYVRGLKLSSFVQNLSKKIKNLLKWALSFKVINRIFEGGFGVTLGDIVNTNPNSNDDNVKIIKEITELDEAESCKKIRLLILQKYGPSKYITYMSRIKLYQENDNIFIKGNAFISDYVYTNFFIVTNNEMKKYYFKVKAC